MPRIPEGKFRLEPSSRVGTAAPKIEGGNTRRARQLGGQMLQVATQMETAKRTADALSNAEKFDEDYENNLVPALQEFSNNSVNGKIQDSIGKEVGYSASVEKLINDHDTKTRAELGDDPEALAYYAKYTKPKMDQQLSKARVFENRQIVDYRNDKLSKKKNVIAQRFIDGEDINLDMMEFNDMAVASKSVIGGAKSDSHINDLKRMVAYQAGNFIKNNGWDEANDAKARATFKNLPEAERREATRVYTDIAQRVKKSQVETTNKAIKDYDGSTQSIKGYQENIYKANELFANVRDASLTEFESKGDRLKNASVLIGKDLAYKSIGLNPAGSREDHLKFVEEMYDKHVSRGLAGSSLEEIVGAKDLRSAAIAKAFDNFSGWVGKKDSQDAGGLQLYTEINPEYNTDIASGNPVRRQTAIAGLRDFNKTANIPRDFQALMSADKAIELGKTFKGLNKGDADPYGKQTWAQITELKRQYGEFGLKAANDAIRLGSGTKGGDTHVPAILSLGVRIGDDAFGEQIMGNYNMLEDNIAKMKDDGIASSKADFEKQIDNQLNGDNLSNLYLGRKGGNTQLYKGFRDGLTARTAHYVTQDNLSISDALEKAQTDMSQHLKIGASGQNTIMVDSEFMKNNNLTEAALNGVTSRLSKLQYIDQMGIEIDYDAMIKHSGNNKYMNSQLKNLEKAKGLGKGEQRKFLLENFGNDIFVSNDPDNPNVAAIYFKPTNGAPIEILTKQKEGSAPMRIDLNEYYKTVDSNTFQRPRGAGSNVMERSHRMAQ